MRKLEPSGRARYSNTPLACCGSCGYFLSKTRAYHITPQTPTLSNTKKKVYLLVAPCCYKTFSLSEASLSKTAVYTNPSRTGLNVYTAVSKKLQCPFLGGGLDTHSHTYYSIAPSHRPTEWLYNLRRLGTLNWSLPRTHASISKYDGEFRKRQAVIRWTARKKQKHMQKRQQNRVTSVCQFEGKKTGAELDGTLVLL